MSRQEAISRIVLVGAEGELRLLVIFAAGVGVSTRLGVAPRSLADPGVRETAAFRKAIENQDCGDEASPANLVRRQFSHHSGD
jgi:hypothetical protein